MIHSRCPKRTRQHIRPHNLRQLLSIVALWTCRICATSNFTLWMMLLNTFLHRFQAKCQIDILFTSTLASDHWVFGDNRPLAGVHLQVFQSCLRARYRCLTVPKWLPKGQFIEIVFVVHEGCVGFEQLKFGRVLHWKSVLQFILVDYRWTDCWLHIWDLDCLLSLALSLLNRVSLILIHIAVRVTPTQFCLVWLYCPKDESTWSLVNFREVFRIVALFASLFGYNDLRLARLVVLR